MALADLQIPADWLPAVRHVIEGPDFRRALIGIKDGWARGDVFPPQDQVLAALELTPLACVRAVILGQDPYHGPGQATGLAFSVADGHSKPRSLQNILKARHLDLGLPYPESGSLENWAANGVLLLNTALTVRRKEPNSHRDHWAAFADAVISAVAAKREPVAFLLWGRQAQSMPAVIRMQAADPGLHVVVPSLHPAAYPHPKERPFVDSKPFSRANEGLCRRRRLPLDWSLTGGAELGSGRTTLKCSPE